MKIYVEVIAIHTIQKIYLPIQIIWKDNRIYEIEKVLQIKDGRTLKEPMKGLYRYKCRISGQIKFLWLEYLEDYKARWLLKRIVKIRIKI